jgi:hypothetical protein
MVYGAAAREQTVPTPIAGDGDGALVRVAIGQVEDGAQWWIFG